MKHFIKSVLFVCILLSFSFTEKGEENLPCSGVGGWRLNNGLAQNVVPYNMVVPVSIGPESGPSTFGAATASIDITNYTANTCVKVYRDATLLGELCGANSIAQFSLPFADCYPLYNTQTANLKFQLVNNDGKPSLIRVRLSSISGTNTVGANSQVYYMVQ